MEEIILKTYRTRTEAELDKVFLESNGIKSFVAADDGGGFLPYLLNGTGFIKLVVAKNDFLKACEVLKIHKARQ